MRSVLLGVVVFLCAAGCQFETSPLAKTGTVKKAARSPSVDAGNRADSKAKDAASSATDSGASTTVSTFVDASVERDAAKPEVDAGSTMQGRDEAGVVGSDAFGMNPTPMDPKMKPQTGGLECGGVFCPFATDPIKPCCTTDTDVAHGAARAADHCGFDFSATSSSFYGDKCWQRDQPGVVDSNCPAVDVGAASSEPGCCSDQGVCGALNSDSALGCHYESDKTPSACVKMPTGGKTCDPLGVFGLRVEVDLAWGGRSGGLAALTDDGRGIQVVHLLANVDSIDPATHELKGTFKPCGVDLPTFYSTTLCEAYKPIFPTTIWESSAMPPPFPLTGRVSCMEPGCIESIDATTVLLGIELDNPEAPWPTSDQTSSITCPHGKGRQCFLNQDGDMWPGLTVDIATSGMAPADGTGCSGQYMYKGAPLSASIAAIFDGVRRTDRVTLGVRMKVGGAAKIADDCSSGLGSGTAEFVNSRGWGCLVEPGTYNFPFVQTAAGATTVCQGSEASFMDANLPIYSILAVGATPSSSLKLKDVSPSKGPQLSVVRLGSAGAAVTCADVRDAMYP